MVADYKHEFIRFMVRSKALTFGDFVTKSGRKTPYFINTGKFTTAEQITKLGQFYAASLRENRNRADYDMLYGPAYKGIPLAVATAIALYSDYQINVPYAFNRKEAKDHGEGGNIIGYAPGDGDRIVIIEDVITAGSSIRESVPLLLAAAKVNITTLLVSVDRMERGQGEKSAMAEIKEEFGIETFSIVTIKEVAEYLHNLPVDGTVYVDDQRMAQIKAHWATFGA